MQRQKRSVGAKFDESHSGDKMRSAGSSGEARDVKTPPNRGMIPVGGAHVSPLSIPRTAGTPADHMKNPEGQELNIRRV
jgi:hypothetical protein